MGEGREEGELAMLNMNGWMDGRVNVGGMGLEEGAMIPRGRMVDYMTERSSAHAYTQQQPRERSTYARGACGARGRTI